VVESTINPIRDIEYLKELLGQGYVVKGTRKDPDKDFEGIQRFLQRGHEFFPEGWLVANGFKLVEPSQFTKGYKLAFRDTSGRLEQYFKSNYSLVKGEETVPLYLVHENPV